MDHVDLNTATFEQLRAILGLSAPEYAALAAARPLRAPADVARALPARLRGAVTSTLVPKLDLNKATAAELTDRVGVPADVARAIKDRGPYDFMSELGAIVSARPALPLLASVFTTPPRTYVDKLTKRRVELSPDPGRVMVASDGSARSDAESSEGSVQIRRMGLKPILRGSSASGMTVYAVPETESAGNVLQNLKRVFGSLVTPVFRDGSGAERYLDPRYCVVQFHREVTPQAQEAIIGRLGLAIEERFRSPGFYLLRVPEGTQAALFQKLEALNARDEVKFAEPNYRGFDDVESPGGSQGAGGAGPISRWNLEMTRIDEAWRYGTGSKDVIIAVLDSGVDAAHPALRGGLLPRGSADWDFTPDGAASPEDDMGHGTFIAGQLVGNGALGLSGLCPGCQVLPLKVPLLGERDSYIRRREAILFAVDTLPPGKRLVMNMSWKTAGDIALIRDAVDTAAARGAVLVASAGNSPERANQPHYPSDYAPVISVGAVDTRRKRSWFSFYGAEVDIAAPGGSDLGGPEERIFSAAPGGGLIDGCGTSFASPHVAGVAALILSAFPALTAAQVREAIETSASPLGEDGLGKGLLDAAAALAAAERLAGAGGAARPPRETKPIGDNPRREASPTGPLPVNELGVEDLVARYGLPIFTARLIVARRPWSSLDAVRGVLGVTEEHLSRLRGDGGSAAGRSDAEWVGRGGSISIVDGIRSVLQWEPTEEMQRSLLERHRARVAAAFERALALFVRAGVGHRLSRLVAALPPEARARLLEAPETVRRLLHGESTDLAFFLRAVAAEHRRLGWPASVEEAVWSAPGDAWFPVGATGPLPQATGDPGPWAEEMPYVSPRLSNGVIVDVESPAARARFNNILKGAFQPHTQAEARALVGKLSAAAALVERACPAAGRLLGRHVKVIVARKDTNDPRSFANFSSDDQPGRITLVNAHAPTISTVVIADRLVHEAIHSFLYVLEETHPFTPDRSVIDSIRKASPWSGNSLGLHSFLHACLVWFGLWKFWERAVASGAVSASEAGAELETARKGFRDPALPGMIGSVLPHVSADARALFPALIRDVREGKHG